MANKTVMEQIEELINEMPLPVVADVEKRLTDWASMGGQPNDPYVAKQLRYLQKVSKATKRK
jgi:hypothetical protein